MSTFATRRLVAGLLVAAVAVLALILITGGDDRRTLKLALTDAAGLRDGSPVTVGGVRVGTVKLKLGDGDRVDATLKIDKGKRIPKDARVAISAVNFLGQKQVAFSGGNPAVPAPDGYLIPASRVSTSTDLDQVLDTLDSDTRTRLAVLVNEAGAAVVGRRWDISHGVNELPRTLADAHTLLSQLSGDNHTLADLVSSSDSFIAATTAKRAEVNRLVDTLGQTSTTVETKRAELAATLAKAPQTLGTLRRFLTHLQETTTPLGPAARDITATAPALDETLSRVEAFRKSADPTLNTATELAPTLTKLGTDATPVIRQAMPTARSLAKLVPAAVPLTDALQHSADNLFGTVENWSQAIQLRDGLSHIFRGEATFSPDLALSVIDRLTKPASTAAAKKQAPARKDGGGATAKPAPDAKPQTPSAASGTDPLEKAVKGLTGAATDVLNQVGGKAKGALDGLLGHKPGQGTQGAAPAPKQGQNPAASLLDFLLGQ